MERKEVAEANVVPACQEFEDVAVAGRLAVGHQFCQLPPDAPTAFINGRLQVDGAARVQELNVSGEAAGKSLGLLSGTGPSSARLTADGTSGQIGLSGSLRIADALGVGVERQAAVSTTARLVVRGDGTPTTPLHVYQDSSGDTLAVVDAEGRVGIGAASGGASLSVQSRHTLEIEGKVTGWAGRSDFVGTGTHFLSELRRRETIRFRAPIPDCTKYAGGKTAT